MNLWHPQVRNIGRAVTVRLYDEETDDCRKSVHVRGTIDSWPDLFTMVVRDEKNCFHAFDFGQTTDIIVPEKFESTVHGYCATPYDLKKARAMAATNRARYDKKHPPLAQNWREAAAVALYTLYEIERGVDFEPKPDVVATLEKAMGARITARLQAQRKGKRVIDATTLHTLCLAGLNRYRLNFLARALDARVDFSTGIGIRIKLNRLKSLFPDGVTRLRDARQMVFDHLRLITY